MTDRDSDRSVFHDGLYKRAISEIGTLREKLPEDAFADLAREVIRRLSDKTDTAAEAVAFPTDAKIEELARALIDPKPDAGIAFIDRIRAKGASVETVYLAYLAQAARTLGDWWEEDKVSFPDVTLATGHIYAVMRGLRPLFKPEEDLRNHPSAFFVGVPGENHLLGLSMAADFYRKNGWEVSLKRGFTHDEIVHYAATSGHRLIGLSGGGSHAIVPLAKLMIALRISAPNAAILISGAVVNTDPESVTALGADIVPDSMDDAVSQSRAFWEQSRNRSQTG
ncbi:cobalamin-dependent protein [uncultured Sulfitobacter sp.]|uniref:cobalamin B12-binding domain-containing protein n=1 Tax=uncultured Sulfitobacter sp. TaxID=191468 RepID=UPI00260B2023|nr:cobalamin-dependent protein [uncultured Sulfitobacter sp.]